MSSRPKHADEFVRTQERLHELEQELEKLRSDYASVSKKCEQLDERVAEANKEAGDYLDLLKRQKADFENYKKRMIKERQQLVGWAVADVMKGLVPVLDDFERAIQSADTSQDHASLTEGINMVYRHLKGFLKKEGLKEISAQGQQFDPHVHEAMMRVESDEHPDNFVTEELRKGYMYKDQVLRPSMVQVNRRSCTEAKPQDKHKEEEGEPEEPEA